MTRVMAVQIQDKVALRDRLRTTMITILVIKMQDTRLLDLPMATENGRRSKSASTIQGISRDPIEADRRRSMISSRNSSALKPTLLTANTRWRSQSLIRNSLVCIRKTIKHKVRHRQTTSTIGHRLLHSSRNGMTIPG